MGLQTRDKKKYLHVIDASLRMTVSEGTPNAVKRTYKTSDGKEGSKWELVFDSLTGQITDLDVFDGDYGKVLHVTVTDGEDYVLTLPVRSDFGMDFMKKLPNVDMTQDVVLIPYSFTPENGNRAIKGITVLQNKVKVQNFFYDVENKKALNGLPTPEGDVSTYDSDDWKMHFMKVTKFLVEYTIDKVKPTIAPKRATEGNSEPIGSDIPDYPEEDINVEDIPDFTNF